MRVCATKEMNWQLYRYHTRPFIIAASSQFSQYSFDIHLFVWWSCNYCCIYSSVAFTVSIPKALMLLSALVRGRSSFPMAHVKRYLLMRRMWSWNSLMVIESIYNQINLWLVPSIVFCRSLRLAVGSLLWRPLNRRTILLTQLYWLLIYLIVLLGNIYCLHNIWFMSDKNLIK